MEAETGCTSAVDEENGAQNITNGEKLFKKNPRKFYPFFLRNGVRPDGRALLETRPLHGKVTDVSRSHGSACVSLGATTAICVVNGEIEQPTEGHDGIGRLRVHGVTVAPGCGMHSREGDTLSYELTAKLQQLLSDPKVLDVSNLNIRPKEAIWVVGVHIVIVSLDGNALDATMLSALLALKHTELPALDRERKPDGKTKFVPSVNPSCPDVVARRVLIRQLPFTVTLGLLGEYWMCDPTQDEEALLDAKTTITDLNSCLNLDLHGANGIALGGNALAQKRSELRRAAAKIAKKWEQWLNSVPSAT